MSLYHTLSKEKNPKLLNVFEMEVKKHTSICLQGWLLNTPLNEHYLNVYILY